LLNKASLNKTSLERKYPMPVQGTVQGTVRGTAEAAAKASVAPSPRSPILLRETIGSVAVLTLNRPAARNSLSEAMIAGLHQALTEIADEKNVRALVIAANGPAFSAGHDMKEMTARRADPDRGRAYFAELMSACSAMMQAIVQLPKPVVAAVQGIATAAGCQLVASCDLAVASEAAGFATPGVDIGLFCSTPMVALSRNVPRKQAMEMLLTGELIPAETARDIGLVNRVVAAGSERDAAIALAAKIAQKSAHTIKLGKQAFYRQAEMSLADAYRYAAEVMTENMLARDAEEGIGAFIEKRAPKWQDR
jgi:enoyl-CoA hydratase/carnithine racemase